MQYLAQSIWPFITVNAITVNERAIKHLSSELGVAGAWAERQSAESLEEGKSWEKRKHH